MYRKGEQRRAEIIAAADRLFARRGFSATTFTDIARVSGVPRGNFYHYFRSKQQVLDAVEARRSAAMAAALARWNRAHDLPSERLARFVGNLGRPPLTEVFGDVPSEIDSITTRSARGRLNLARLWLQAQIGQLGAADPAAKAQHLLSWCQGAVMLARLEHDKDWLAREVAAMERWLDALARIRRRA